MLSLLAPARLLAAETTLGEGVTSASDITPELGTSALQMFFWLFVVLALLLVMLWLLKRLGAPSGSAPDLLKVVAGVAVGQRERVVILEFANNWLVLGVAPGQVTLLAEIPRQELALQNASGTAKEFQVWLRQIINRDKV